MNVLSESMRAASAAPPPNRIDLDALIAGERRRRRGLRVGGSGLAVLAAVGAVAIALTPSPGGVAVGVTPTPSTSESCVAPPSRTPVPAASKSTDTVTTLRPPPTESAEAAAHRLSVGFDEALRTVVPGTTFTDFVRPGCRLVLFANYGKTFLYEGMAVFTDSAGTAGIAAHIYQAPAGRPSCDRAGCTYDWIKDLPGGAVAFGFGDRQVRVWRADGTAVMILAAAAGNNSVFTRPTSPVSRDQMIAIAQFPALTLYP